MAPTMEQERAQFQVTVAAYQEFVVVLKAANQRLICENAVLSGQRDDANAEANRLSGPEKKWGKANV